MSARRAPPGALAVALLLAALAGCMPAAQESSPARAGAPTLDELRNLTYHGLSADSTVTLQDGGWTGKPFVPGGEAAPRVTLVPGFRVVGDLDGDGADEAVVLLAESSGGSGVFSYVAVAGRVNGAPVDEGTAALGDRVQVRDARVADQALVLDLVRAGPGDAMCCPGELARRTWWLGEHGLVAKADSVTGRLSPAVLGEGEWVLHGWDRNEPAPATPAITLRYDQGRVSGSSGCNRYTATLAAGDSPGEATLGPVVGTKMACPDSVMGVESRFLERLAGVNRYGFLAGRLGLQYRAGDSTGVLVFDRRDTRVAQDAEGGTTGEGGAAAQ